MPSEQYKQAERLALAEKKIMETVRDLSDWHDSFRRAEIEFEAQYPGVNWRIPYYLALEVREKSDKKDAPVSVQARCVKCGCTKFSVEEVDARNHGLRCAACGDFSWAGKKEVAIIAEDEQQAFGLY